MAIDVSNELKAIEEAVYGEEVRGSIHDSIEKIADEVNVSNPLVVRRAIAPLFSNDSEQVYNVGDYVYRLDPTQPEAPSLYKCQTPTTGGTFDGSCWIKASLGEDFAKRVEVNQFRFDSATSPNILAGKSCDDLTTPALWFVNKVEGISTLTDFPIDGPGFIRISGPNAYRLIQQAYPADFESSSYCLIRTKNGGAWGEWRKLSGGGSMSVTDTTLNIDPEGAAGEVITQIADEFSSLVSYAVGDLVTKDGILYKFTASHPAGEWNSNHVSSTSVETELRSMSDKVDDAVSDIHGIVDSTLSVSGKAADAKVTGDEITGLKTDLNSGIESLANGVQVVDKNITWQNGYINRNGSILASTASRFALVPMNAGETVVIGTSNLNITIIGSTTADSVAVGDTVTVIQKTTASGAFETYTYTATEAINLVLCVKLSDYTLSFHKTAPFMDMKQDVLVFDNEPINGSSRPVTSNGIYAYVGNYFHTSPNIADPSDFVVGEFVNQATGVFTENSLHERTGFVPVVGGLNYCIVNSSENNRAEIRYAWYNANHVFIRGGTGVLETFGSVVTAPTNAEYLVMSGNKSFFPYMIAQSSTAIGYEEYGVTYLKPEYIPDDTDEDILLNLPSTIYATSGIELNIYFENITERWEEFEWNVQCSKGMQLERGYRVTPTDTDTGSYSLTITAKKPESSKLYSKSATLVISASTAGSGQTKNIIIMGDSTTDNGGVIIKINENFENDAMNVNTLGTRGTAPNNHEGRSGWTLNDYFTRESITYPAGDPRGTVYNPFYNPTTQTWDASYYFANSGISAPDYFIINMGINDMFSFTSDSALETQIETCLGYLNSMVNSIKAVSTNIKICICVTIPPNDSQDAFGKAYACGQTRDRYKRNNCLWANAIIDEFDTNEDVSVIPIHTNLDTVYNMGLETLPVNSRNTEVTYDSPIANGGVHPALVGYWQIADIYTAFLKADAS